MKGTIKATHTTYTLYTLLGSGASYKAYLAKSSDGKRVAVKVIKEFNDPQFKVDVLLYKNYDLNHKNIIKILHVGQDILEKSSGKKKYV